MSPDQPNNGQRRLLWQIVKWAAVIAMAASAGWIAAYERRLASVEALAGTTADIQRQRGERFLNAENRLTGHDNVLSELKGDIREVQNTLVEIRELLIQANIAQPRQQPASRPFSRERPPPGSREAPPHPTWPSTGAPATGPTR